MTLVVLATLTEDPGRKVDLYLQWRHTSVTLSNTFGKQHIDAPMVKLVFGDINSNDFETTSSYSLTTISAEFGEVLNSRFQSADS